MQVSVNWVNASELLRHALFFAVRADDAVEGIRRAAGRLVIVPDLKLAE